MLIIVVCVLAELAGSPPHMFFVSLRHEHMH
jgi:hypothetical protein